MLLETQARLEQRHPGQEFRLQAFQELIDHIVVVQEACPREVGPWPGHAVAEVVRSRRPGTRGAAMTRELMQGFIAGLDLPEAEKVRLLAMTPGSYVGLAAALARRV